MVALRSRRLETLLGTPLDDLQYQHLEALVTNHVNEAFDLDFKATLYGNADRDRRDLATDVAALANTAGGLLVLGIEEDRQARAVAAPGVEVSDAEIRRILQVVGSLVVPLPVFEPLPFVKPGETDHGFLVIAVLRGPLTPHAVIVNQGLRYPRRNGTTTRYLSEPEVASACRERLAGIQHQAARVEEVEREALLRLDASGLPWVVVSLVPDLPGELSITSEVFKTFQQTIMGQPAMMVAEIGTRFRRASVGGGACSRTAPWMVPRRRRGPRLNCTPTDPASTAYAFPTCWSAAGQCLHRLASHWSDGSGMKVSPSPLSPGCSPWPSMRGIEQRLVATP
jgi:schlafen family protein